MSAVHKAGIIGTGFIGPAHVEAAATDIVKIGKSERNLQFEVLNHFGRHTCSNRLERICQRPGIKVSVVWVGTNEATAVESMLLREFEDRYFDLPVLNAQRGYACDADKHYRG